jgi:glutamine synthetase adenylyltransferase
LLDVYFVVRYLHLLNIDSLGPELRSTSARLGAFRAGGILTTEDHIALSEGHGFLSMLDHNIRLAIGRSSRFPRANHAVLERIAARMRLGSAEALFQQLAVHRMSIRTAFENVFDR